MFMFGAGNLFLTESGVANPKTHLVGTLQEVSFDISFESKELYGNMQFPVMVARGKGKITGKAKSGEFRGAMITSILSGSTRVSGRKLHASAEPHTVAAPTSTTTSTTTGAPATVTVTATHAADFAQDLGVRYAANDEPLTRVAAGSEAAGKYSVDETTGVYTLAVADVGDILLDYVYDAIDGSTILYSNQLMGAQLIYSLGLYNVEPDGKKFGIKFKQVVLPKLALGFKNDDFTMPDIDLSAFAHADKSILEAYSPESL